MYKVYVCTYIRTCTLSTILHIMLIHMHNYVYLHVRIYVPTYSIQVRKKAQAVVPVMMEKVGYDSMLKHAGKLKV